MMGRPFSNSYMVTNRAWPTQRWGSYIYPTAAGTMFHFLAPGADNADPDAYRAVDESPSASMPASYRAALAADLLRAVQDGGAQVTVYIHGLAYYFADACQALGTYGVNLAAQGYKGLLVGFSWPSYGPTDSVVYYGSSPCTFPPTADSGTIRDNIHGSTSSLLSLLDVLASLCDEQGATLNIVCHSEGNYLLMLAMHALSTGANSAWRRLAGAGRVLNQVLLVAADINNGALEPPQGSPPVAGQGAWIAQHARSVTVYWSSADSMLAISDGWTSYHNASFPKRLGRHGPESYATDRFVANACGLDCSLVVDANNPHTPWKVSVHESYFYIPQVLADMRQVLDGVPPGDVANRVLAGSPGERAFRMRLVAATPALGAVRLPKAQPPGD